MQQQSVALAGEVDLSVRDATMSMIEAACVAAVDDDTVVVVDLSAVTFMDSTGIACLARATTLLPEPARLRLRAPAPNVRRLLEVAGFEHLLESE